jgi:cob(I)alamin adenosyltransferase
METLGDVDELNAVLGSLCSMLSKEHSGAIAEIQWIQSCLLQAGSLLATTPGSPSFVLLKTIQEEQIKSLEAAIDRMDIELPELRLFILPGGHPSAAWAHVARAVCRRTERRVVDLFSEMKGGEDKEKLRGVAVFLNRLSDYLFVFARYCNHVYRVEERVWSE